MRYLIVYAVLTFDVVFVLGHYHGDSASSHTGEKPLVNEIWKRYGRSDFVFDTNHIVEELKNIMDLHDSKKLKPSEAVFYYHRLHDFNLDGSLDGLELMQAAKHSYIHAEQKAEDMDLLIKNVDQQLEHFDKNQDGFIEYSELMQEVKDDDDNKSN